MLSEVRGQAEGTRFLQRVVDGDLKAPLLLVGPAGTGRRFSVLQAAKQSFGPSAIMIDAGTHPDLWQVEPEPGKDLKVDAVRDLLDRAASWPTLARDRYIVIDGADRMTAGADNALLKTLEEPPPSTRFFLLAEHRQDVLPTIRSRCGLVRYNRLSESLIFGKLSEHESNETLALTCTRLADGSLGRALKIYHGSRIALRDRMMAIFRAAAHRDLVDAFHGIDAAGDDLREGLGFLDHLVKDTFLVEHDPAAVANLDLVSDLRGLRHKLGLMKLAQVRAGLRALGTLPKPALISFHLKAALASALIQG